MAIIGIVLYLRLKPYEPAILPAGAGQRGLGKRSVGPVALGAGVPPDPAARISALRSRNYIAAQMDGFQRRFYVSTDVSAAGDHFHAYAKFEDQTAPVTIDGSSTTLPHSGATCIRNSFDANAGQPFGGWMFQNGQLTGSQRAPQSNFGEIPDAGVILSGSVTLTFWARGEKGGEVVDFFVAGVGYADPSDPKKATAPYPDSSPAIHLPVRLTRTWRPYRIVLTRADLSYVLGGFGWGCSAAQNPAGATFYLDDIQFNLNPTTIARRLNEPRFIRSYLTGPHQPTIDLTDPQKPKIEGPYTIDFVLRNVAYIYDNSLAILALLADGRGDSVRRAILLGDALLYAQEHDRSFTDGSVRDALTGGDLRLPPGWPPEGKIGTVGVPGFYIEANQTFYEVNQDQHSVGNQAWAMIALLALYERTHIPEYLAGATKLGDSILAYANHAAPYAGFLFGQVASPQGTLQPVNYSSTEHNLDVYAAFTVMNALAPDAKWSDGAALALSFIDAMWDPQRGCYYVGTTDLTTRNDNAAGDPSWHKLALDTQAWGVLAVGQVRPERTAQLLAFAEANHAVTDLGFTGFDFNDDKDGVWPEGTAQMCTAYAMAGMTAPARKYRLALRTIQTARSYAAAGGVTSALRDGLTTGFDFEYFNRPHLGATSWNVFAQLGVNPYYLHPAAPAPGRAPKPVLRAVQARPSAVNGGAADVKLSVSITCLAGIRKVTANITSPSHPPLSVLLQSEAGSHVGGVWSTTVALPVSADPYQVVLSVEDTEEHVVSSPKATVRIAD
jgi:hypothetical protein